jgi:hypothetical protein
MADAATLNIDVNTEKAVKSIESFTSSLKKVAAAAVAVFASKQIVDFFDSGIQAAIAQEQAMASLGQQLKATGEFSTQALEQFASFADEMEKTTQYGDDLVISQLAVAKAMGLSNEQSKELVKAASELSAVTGDSLASSVEQLGKTYDGVTGKSPVLRAALAGVSKEALEAGKGIKAVQDALGGSAAAQINTYAGALKQAENAYGNFQESIGKIVIENPTLIAAIKGATEIFSLLETSIKDNSEEISKFVTTSVQILLFSLNQIVNGTGLAIKSFQILSNGLLVFGAASLKAAEIFLKLFGGEESKKRAQELENLGLQFETFFKERVESQKDFNAGFDDLAKKIEEISLKAANATEKLSAAEQKAKEERDKRTKAEKKAQEEKEKYLKEFAALEKRITLETATELEKLTIKRDEDLSAIKKYENLGVVSKEQANNLKKSLDEKYERERKAITDKGLDDEIRAYENNIKEIKRTFGEKTEIVSSESRKISKVFSELVFKTNVVVDSEGLVKSVNRVFSETILGQVSSLLSSIQSGKSGAANFIAGLGGTIGSAVGVAFAGPAGQALGGIIQQALSLVMQDPKTLREQIKGFSDGLKELPNTLVENVRQIPKLIAEGFLDGITSFISSLGPMINGIIQSGLEALDAFFASIPENAAGAIIGVVEGVAEAIVDVVQNVVDLLDAPYEFKKTVLDAAYEFRAAIRDTRRDLKIAGGELSAAFKKAVLDTGTAFALFKQQVQTYFSRDFPRDVKNGAMAFRDGIANGIEAFVAGVSKAGTEFFRGIVPSILLAKDFINSIGPKIAEFTTASLQSIGEALTDFRDKIIAGADGLGRNISDQYKGAADNFAVFFKEKLPEAFKDLGDQFSSAAKNFGDGIASAAKNFGKEISDAFKGAFGGGGGGGDKNPISAALGLARGITEVPRGFPNDTFPARLSSGERVVDNRTNQDLKDFLANSRAGGLGNEQMITLLSEISSKIGNSSGTTIELTLDKKVLSKTILDLNRRNERLSV